MRSNAIDWDGFKDTYNQIHKTNFKTPKEWIIFLYNKHNKFVSPVSEELGIGFGTASKYIEKLGILERKPKGGNNYTDRPIGKKEQLFLTIPEKTMTELTKAQICERCNLSKDYTTRLIRKHKRKYTLCYGG